MELMTNDEWSKSGSLFHSSLVIQTRALFSCLLRRLFQNPPREATRWNLIGPAHREPLRIRANDFQPGREGHGAGAHARE